MAKKKIQLPDVLKKDLKILGFLLLNGLVAWISMKIEADPVLSLVFGGVANYVVYRSIEELKNEGYVRALKK